MVVRHLPQVFHEETWEDTAPCEYCGSKTIITRYFFIDQLTQQDFSEKNSDGILCNHGLLRIIDCPNCGRIAMFTDGETYND